MVDVDRVDRWLLARSTSKERQRPAERQQNEDMCQMFRERCVHVSAFLKAVSHDVGGR